MKRLKIPLFLMEHSNERNGLSSCERGRTEERKKKKRKNEKRVSEELKRLIDDPETKWIVEKILKKELNEDGKEGYWVRWEGFSEEWDTWEPRDELERNAKALVAQFENLNDPDLDTADQHCICRKPYRPEDGAMIQCYYCLTWFHFKCLEIDVVKANNFIKFYCEGCEQRNPYANTKYKNIVDEKCDPFYSESSTDSLWSASAC